MSQASAPGSGSATLMEAPHVAHDRRSVVLRIAGGLAAAFVIVAATAVDLWFLPFIFGVIAGLAARRSRSCVVLPGTAVSAVIGWAIPLVWHAAHGQPVGATARAVAALAGLPPSATLIVSLTLLVAAIQSIVGGWLALAIVGRRTKP